MSEPHPQRDLHAWLRACAATCAGLVCVPTPAAELAWSGYGTLGYARSDRPYAYQRTITDEGTFLRDSVLGLQLDAKLDGQFSATLQVKAAQASDHDRSYRPSVAWAFLAYRPSNDWLFRLGKQRIPVYLFSETYDVGVTYEFARLPTEMYSLVPSNDAVGASFSRSWSRSTGEFTVDGYAGTSKNDVRIFGRDTVLGLWNRGPAYLRLNFKGGGVVLSWRHEDLTARFGLHHAIIQRADGLGFYTDIPFVPVPGYYQSFDDLPGPGIPKADKLSNTVVAAGLDTKLSDDLRVVTEVAYNRIPKSYLAPQGIRGYISLLKEIGRWRPYLTVAAMRSPRRALDTYTSIDGTALSINAPSDAIINASQRAIADQLLVFDQISLAVGTSFAFSAKTKLKAEFMRSRIGRVSQLVDAPEGGNVRHQSISVLSLSYSFVY